MAPNPCIRPLEKPPSYLRAQRNYRVAVKNFLHGQQLRGKKQSYFLPSLHTIRPCPSGTPFAVAPR
eukprot:1042479-Rhodomonas_salina.3